jgi:hypothetical protein
MLPIEDSNGQTERTDRRKKITDHNRKQFKLRLVEVLIAVTSGI